MSTQNKILIVDDDKANQKICSSVLSKFYSVQLASNGIEALEKIEAFEPDVVLLDWEMPLKNGLETLIEIKSNNKYKEIQVIMMTGMMTEQKNLLQAFNHGVVDFIRKPFDTVELLARVKSVVTIVNFYKEQLQYKTRQLLTLTLRLAENAELIEATINNMEELITQTYNSAEEMSESLNSLREKMLLNLSESTWKEFETYFIEVHPNFYKNLTQKHPDLSLAELKLAALIYLKLDTKEIASILHISPESVKVSRSRLKKKLVDDNNDIVLFNYLSQF